MVEMPLTGFKSRYWQGRVPSWRPWKRIYFHAFSWLSRLSTYLFLWTHFSIFKVIDSQSNLSHIASGWLGHFCHSVPHLRILIVIYWAHLDNKLWPNILTFFKLKWTILLKKQGAGGVGIQDLMQEMVRQYQEMTFEHMEVVLEGQMAE